jgi:hypothetical protein
VKHAEANQIVKRAFQKIAGRAASDQEAAYCQAVAWLETMYGRGGQFATLFAKGTVNWGALETARPSSGVCPPGTSLGTDQGQVCFFVYPSDDAAAEAFLTTLLTANRTPGKSPVQAKMIQAMAGSPLDVASAMKDFAYYGVTRAKNAALAETQVQGYAAAIASSLKTNAAPGGITDQGQRFTTPEPPAGTPPQTPATPGATPGSGVPFYRRTPFLVAAGALGVLGAAAAVRALR